MQLRNIIDKKIKKTFKEIEIFSKSDSFIIDQSFNNYLNNCKLHLKWDTNSNELNFELELINELSPHNINFKKIGLNDDITISSNNQKLVIPALGINKIIANQFVFTKKIKGVISCLFSKNLVLSDLKNFRLLVNINDENITTIFTGSQYKCNEVEYGHGLTSLEINNKNFDVFRCQNNGQKILVLESKDKIDFKTFKNTCKHIVKGIALLTGNWYRDKYYIVSSNDSSFNEIDSIHYESLNKSIITDLGIIKPFEFKIYNEEVNNIKGLLTDNLFPANIFSKIIEKSLSNETFNRTIEMIIESSSNDSFVIRSSMYYISLEAIVGLIYHENKAKLKPIKDTKDLNDLLDKIALVVSKYEDKFTSKEFEVINKKIEHLNTPFNVDKPLKIFEFYKIKLSDRFITLLKNRNKFLHGSIPYRKDELKNNQLNINLDSLRIQLLSTILVLKYVNYSGHIKNLAGQFLFDTNRFSDGNNELTESIYYEI